MCVKLSKNVFFNPYEKKVIKYFSSKDDAKIEYDNIIFLKNKLKAHNIFFFPEIITLKKELGIIKMSYVDAYNMVNLINKGKYHVMLNFGRKLRKFHNLGLTHGELELQDILYKNNKFYLFDWFFLNKRTKECDISRLLISIDLWRIKKSFWVLTNRKHFFLAKRYFLKGYYKTRSSFMESNHCLEKALNRELINIISVYLKQKTPTEKIRGIILLILSFLGEFKNVSI